MRKKWLLITLLMSAGLQATWAQTQLVNGSMEAWDNLGSSSEEPQQWNSFMTANCTLGSFICTNFAQTQHVARSTDKRPGSPGTYSARIYSENAFGVIANGNLTTGKINMGSSTPADASNYNYTDRAAAAHRMPLTARPDSIVFWAKYQPGNNSTTEMARMRAVVHDDYNYRDPSDANAAPHEVGNATINYTRTHNGTAYIWKRFSVPFTYSGPATTPAYILVTFTTNQTPGGGSSTDQVWIDDVELVYVPVTISASAISPLSYTVSPTTGASISIPFTKTGNFAPGNVFTAQLSDAAGSFASPVSLGTLTSTTAGTIAGTIPAGTAAGTGYRVRVIASAPYQTANPNTSDITINLVNNSIAPVAAQTLVAGSNGTALTVTESGTADSRVWKFATASGGPYTAFTPGETGTSYTPNFTNAGTYYVVCESTFGSLSARSNEVIVTVVKNQVSPAGTQNILVNTPGSTLTVTETPAGTAREWKFSTTAGGPYNAFSPAETGTTYQPLFASAGTYYVVCQSTISGLQAQSNEVVISAGNINLNTGTITGSPFEFSASAPDINVSVPYTVSNPFNPGNTFTAQLSDASGSFTAPTVIGSVAAVTDGSINATIPASTPAGTGYLIRVVASDPAILGADNGTALTVDQFNNSISPSAAQTFVYTATGTAITVSESQAATSREWRIGTVSGGPYSAITPAQTGTSYTPSVTAPGTYYVVCASTNIHGDEVLSNEVMLTAENANAISTSAVSGSPFYVSPSANNVVSVDFTSPTVFDSGNVFTAQLSDAAGSFALPVTIGTLTAQTPGTIAAVLPNVILAGTGYRIRVVSSSPAITGTDNGTDLELINYNVSVAPTDSQHVIINTVTPPLTTQSSHPGVSITWKSRASMLSPYESFTPPKTGNTFTHTFTSVGTFYVVAEVVNNWNDTLLTPPVIFSVRNQVPSGIAENGETGSVHVFQTNGQWLVDLTPSTFQMPDIQLVNMAGQVVFTRSLKGNAVHALPLILAPGIYTYRLTENGKTAVGKIAIRE